MNPGVAKRRAQKIEYALKGLQIRASRGTILCVTKEAEKAIT